MRIVAADTGGAVLDESFQPVGLIATVAVLVEKPYKTSKRFLVKYADPYNYDLSGRQAIRDEIELAIELAREVSPDVIHLDSTLGGIEVRKLDESTIDALQISDRGKEIWKELSKDLQPLAKKFWEETGIEIIAIGKSSVPVRIAEIYAGIFSVKWALDNVKEKGGLLVGLPRYMEVEIKKDKIIGKSLDPREGGLYGEVKTEVPQGIKWELYPNPLVRRFMVFEITSKS
ncbi:DUF4152 family protein [Pyrococcus horikoshii]|uniref:3-5 exonuclease PhoExo I n=1 Tax=Pyrococcus horikoshii TaxID=53953 RepID=A0A060P168_PYRHR|nr:DUF4152 family protein [Pyrococcus horikoshii]4YOR_A Chain A, 3-5 exonuclease PhoExo I [Pyrococcus horikoshii]4YOR_B Chain B, 3-5 exonuclease PhoExo I [Pyrococcus horikoshii]4YOT_A Chain A, 3-5 exonuclease PhoExo I [Pyrococcus horikoshii]4YOT_B Chain B, 3-5 exonuclease PhoExo I [Pyrococcus horikoshii]4YOT_C Chain C, 3-5 exonuclease PhoExo I [Pyrococcus horikoshii]4YOU_A Chain A, 3-5 exonuclease PhoExo I [Pyrococcus horikoshii]4YOU_B Chain B, 3-5 exonuclease PhoExo I [Pyrococcus horikoshii